MKIRRPSPNRHSRSGPFRNPGPGGSPRLGLGTTCDEWGRSGVLAVWCNGSSACRRFFSAAAWPQGAARRMSGSPPSMLPGSHLPGWRRSSPEKLGCSTTATLTAGLRTSSRSTGSWSRCSGSSRPRLPPPAQRRTARCRSGCTVRPCASSSRRAHIASCQPLSRSGSQELRHRRLRAVQVDSFESFLPGRGVPPA
jgi:hypothetical protein